MKKFFKVFAVIIGLIGVLFVIFGVLCSSDNHNEVFVTSVRVFGGLWIILMAILIIKDKGITRQNIEFVVDNDLFDDFDDDLEEVKFTDDEGEDESEQTISRIIKNDDWLHCVEVAENVEQIR